jgi:hypothetical protein
MKSVHAERVIKKNDARETFARVKKTPADPRVAEACSITDYARTRGYFA